MYVCVCVRAQISGLVCFPTSFIAPVYFRPIEAPARISDEEFMNVKMFECYVKALALRVWSNALNVWLAKPSQCSVR